MVEAALKSFLTKHPVPIGGNVLAGVSGGLDSTVMVTALRETIGQRVVVCHLHHGLRGREADRDADFVRNLAARLGLRWLGGKSDVRAEARRDGISVEEAGRRARHRFLASCARRSGTRLVFLAHHGDDQVETVLTNLVRGAAGLRGMKPVTELVPPGCRLPLVLCRPLLDVPRAELQAWAAARGLEWRDDESNDDRSMLRNRLRHDAIPALLAAAGRDFRAALRRAAAMAAEDAAFLDQLAAPAAAAAELETATLRSLAPALRRRVLHAWLRRHGVPDCGAAEVLSVLAMIETGGPARVSLPGAMEARRTRGRLRLAPVSERKA